MTLDRRLMVTALLATSIVCLAAIGSDAGLSHRLCGHIVVVDTDGRPVAGATIRAYNGATGRIGLSGSPLHSLMTGQLGRALLPCEPAAAVRLVIHARGYRLRVVRLDALVTPVTLRRGRDVHFELRDDVGAVRGRVEWNAAEDVTLSVDSDALGRGILPGLPIAPVGITVSTAGGTRQLLVEPTDTLSIVKMPRTSVLEGRTYSELREPLQTVTARLIGSNARETLVDALGRFRFGGLPPGEYYLELSAPGYRAEAMQVSIQPGHSVTLQPVVMATGSTLTVRFADASTGDLIQKPTVKLQSRHTDGFDPRDLLRPLPRYVGSARGELSISDLPVGVHRLVLDAPPYARTTLPPVEVHEQPTRIDLGTLTVDRGATLEVRVVDRSGAPRPGERVFIDHGPALSPLHPEEALTDSDGVARVQRLGPGRYRYRVGGDDRPGGTVAYYEEWLTATGAEQVIRRKVVRGGLDVPVRIYNDLGPLAATGVFATIDSNGDLPEHGLVVQTPRRMINAPFSRSSHAVTDQEGRAILSNVPTGAVRIGVSLGLAQWSFPIFLDDNRSAPEVALQVPGTEIAVLPKDRDTGAPVGARGRWESRSGVRVSGAAGTDGYVRLPGVPLESGTLSLEAALYEPDTHPYDVPAAVPAEALLTKLGPTTLRCRVLAQDGQSLTGASVEWRQPGASLSRRHAAADVNGAVEFANLDYRAGAGRLIVRYPNYPSQILPLSLRSGLNDLGAVTLQKGYRVRISLEQDEQTRGPFAIRILNETNLEVQDGLDEFSDMMIRAGGEASLGALAPGTYTIELINSSRHLISRSVTIHDSDVQLQLK